MQQVARFKVRFILENGKPCFDNEMFSEKKAAQARMAELKKSDKESGLKNSKYAVARVMISATVIEKKKEEASKKPSSKEKSKAGGGK